MTKPRVEKTPPRPSMSKARRARIFEMYGGICYLSGVKIGPNDAWDVEHVIPWWISQDDSDANLRPALKEPHKAKTKHDVKTIAKVRHMSGGKGSQQARRAKRKAEEAERGIIKPKSKIPSRQFPKGKSRWAKRKAGE